MNAMELRVLLHDRVVLLLCGMWGFFGCRGPYIPPGSPFMDSPDGMRGSAEEPDAAIVSTDVRVRQDLSAFEDSLYADEASIVLDGHEASLDAAGPRQDGGTFSGSVRHLVSSCRMTCVILMNGAVYCWGDEAAINKVTPREVRFRPRQVAGLHEIVQMGMSCEAACAVDRNHAVWCWGENYRSGLRTGSDERFLNTPGRRRDVEDILHIAWSGSIFIAQRMEGTLYGLESLTASTFDRSFPSPAVDVSGGTIAYCTVLANGQVACRGPNISAVRPWTFSEGPRLVAGLSDVTSVAIGLSFYCALKRDGTVWCWGYNDVGQTGTPPEEAERCFQQSTVNYALYTSCVNQPRQVPGLRDVVQISAYESRVCARLRDGTVWCWGDNPTPDDLRDGTGGLLGDGAPNTEVCPSAFVVPEYYVPRSFPCRRRPTQVAGVTGATAISVGGEFACAAVASGQVYCWGDNLNGALGDGTTRSHVIPAPVIGPP
mgnify:CR=1 FL=1